MSITDQITVPLPCLLCVNLSAQQAYPSPSREICHYSEKFSRPLQHIRTLLSCSASGVKLGNCSSVLPIASCRIPFALCPFVAVASCNLHSHGSGSTPVSSILMAWKPPVGTDYRQEYSVRHCCFSCQRLAVLPAVPSLRGESKAPRSALSHR
jgi:hypothetical protein